MGYLTGSVEIGKSVHQLNLMSIRDHSTGERFWICVSAPWKTLPDLSFLPGPRRDFDLLYRYAFYMMFLEDGTMSSVIIVNQPCSVST